MDEKNLMLTIRVCSDISIDFIKVESGKFKMGGTGAFSNPPQWMELNKDFYISKHLITQKVWSSIMDYDCPTKYIGINRPVDEVELEDCVCFVNKIRCLTGLNIDIPTEAQWEYAAKGGKYSKGFILSGSNDPDDLYSRNEISDGYQTLTNDVGVFKPNEIGLYDMNSNVSQWCKSCVNSDFTLKGGVLGYEGGLIWEECSISASFGSKRTADSYVPNTGIRLVVNL